MWAVQWAVLFFIVFALFDVSTAADKKLCERYFQFKRGVSDPGCVDICKRECTNGACDQQGACNCSRGYENVRYSYYQCARVCPATDYPENSAYCRTKCQDSCVYGTCDNLGRCNCNVRFTNHPRNHYLCEPMCEPKCRNGHCAPSFKCACRNGYQIIEPYGNCGKLCDSSSKPCGNGECSGNGTCSCHTGYVNDGTNACVPVTPTTVAPVAQSCETGQTAVNGKCMKRCSTNQDCPSESPRCSRSGFCAAGSGLPDDCADRCKSGCEQSCDRGKCASSEVCPCESGAANVETCTTVCKRDKCGKGGETTGSVAPGGIAELFSGEQGWVIVIGISITVLVVILAIVLGVMVRVKKRRRDEDRSGDRRPMTEMSYRGMVENENNRNPDGGTGSGQTKEFQESDTYMVPRGVKEEPRYSTAQFSSTEGTARNPRMPGQRDSPGRVSYMNMHDLPQEAEDDPMYLNVANAQDDNIYENYNGMRY